MRNHLLYNILVCVQRRSMEADDRAAAPMPPAALQPNFPRYQRSAHEQVVHLGQVPLSPRREAAYAAIMDEFDDVYDDLTSMHKVCSHSL